MTKPADNSNHEHMLLRTNLKLLRLPTISSEFEKLAREAAAANRSFEQCLLRLAELKVAARQTNALKTRIKNATFPVIKDLRRQAWSTNWRAPRSSTSSSGSWASWTRWTCWSVTSWDI